MSLFNLSDFQKDLREGLTIDEACNKYNVSFGEIVSMSINSSPKPHNVNKLPKYVYKVAGGYVVRGYYKGSNNYYLGKYKTLREAKMISEEMQECGFDKSKLEDIKHRLGIKSVSDLKRDKREANNFYYHHLNNSYPVTKRIGGEWLYFGSYRNKEEASKIVKELVKVNWDKEKLPFIKEKLGIEERVEIIPSKSKSKEGVE